MCFVKLFMLEIVDMSSKTCLENMMPEHDLEEAHYYWVLSDVCDMIRLYGYTKVLIDIDKALKNEDLEVEIKNMMDEE